jgi:hypothetical protein
MISRTSAAAAGLVLLAVSPPGAFLVFWGVVTIEPPNPFLYDDRPCCAHPDTWGGVLGGVAWTLGAALVEALVLLVAAAALQLAAAVRHDPASDCDAFVLDRDEWRWDPAHLTS